MTNIKPNTIQEEKKRMYGYYAIIAKACGCTRSYVRQVLTENMGTYKGKIYSYRDTELAQMIRKKAEELEEFLNHHTNKNS